MNEWMNDKGRYSVLKRDIFEEMIRTCRKWAFYRIERLLDFIFKSNKTCRKWAFYRSGSRDCAAGSPPPRPPEELCWEPPVNDDWDWQWSLLAMIIIGNDDYWQWSLLTMIIIGNDHYWQWWYRWKEPRECSLQSPQSPSSPSKIYSPHL